MTLQIGHTPRELPETIPVDREPVAEVDRPQRGPISVYMPYLGPPTRANRDWLEQVIGRRKRITWNGEDKCWQVARAHYPRIVNALMFAFGPVRVFEVHDKRVMCDTRCQDATGEECVCRCLGQNHGIVNYANHTGLEAGGQWRLIGETTLVGHGEIVRAERLRIPNISRPVTEWEADGFEQYSYSVRRSPVKGTCPMCREVKPLVVDHCHEHGWIRGRICTSCNVRLGIDEGKNRSTYMIPNVDDYGYLAEPALRQYLKCPDCNMHFNTLEDNARVIDGTKAEAIAKVTNVAKPVKLHRGMQSEKVLPIYETPFICGHTFYVDGFSSSDMHKVKAGKCPWCIKGETLPESPFSHWPNYHVRNTADEICPWCERPNMRALQIWRVKIQEDGSTGWCYSAAEDAIFV